ncbi:MAG: hypothetical protein WKF34_01120 [Pyrinomonadaceae bacterium]
MMTFDQIGQNLPALLISLFVCVLFVQSSLDKVFDWKGNLAWLTGHFEKTFLAPGVPVMLAMITVMEAVTGALAGAGIIYYVMTGSLLPIFLAGFVGALSLIALFFGQRVAKDYPGAAVLVPYFLLQIVLIYLTNPHHAH